MTTTFSKCVRLQEMCLSDSDDRADVTGRACSALKTSWLWMFVHAYPALTNHTDEAMLTWSLQLTQLWPQLHQFQKGVGRSIQIETCCPSPRPVCPALNPFSFLTLFLHFLHFLYFHSVIDFMCVFICLSTVFNQTLCLNMCDTHWTAQSIIKCIKCFQNPQLSMTHVCASVSLSVLLILKASHLFFSYTHWLFQSCFNICKCCSAGKSLKCAHPWSSDGTYSVMTPFAVTSEILHCEANYDTHSSTYSAVTGFSSSPSLWSANEVQSEVIITE